MRVGDMRVREASLRPAAGCHAAQKRFAKAMLALQRSVFLQSSGEGMPLSFSMVLEGTVMEKSPPMEVDV